MTSISFTGAFALQSSNGDAGQVLTEAAGLVNTLAQLGVSLSVRIEIAPKDAPAAPAILPVHLNGSAPARLPAVVDLEPAPEYEADPPANPTPAAPVTPDAPPAGVETLLLDLEEGRTRFKNLNTDEQAQVIEELGVRLTALLGRLPEKKDWNSMKPAWMPTAHALSYWKGGRGWPELQLRFLRSYEHRCETSMATPSGESASDVAS